MKINDFYSPVQDTARANLPGRSYRDRDVLLGSDFECGNSYRFRRIDAGRYALEIEPEPGTHEFSGKGYYFCFAIVNRHAVPRTVSIELGSPNQEGYSWRTQHVIVKRGGTWSHLPAESILTPPDEHTISFRLQLPGRGEPDAALFVSNYHWHPYAEMSAYLQGLSQSRPEMHLLSIGKSSQGRNLWAVEAGVPDGNAPVMVLAQTPQPSEMGHFACRAILDFLLSDDPAAARIRARHRVCLIPHTNPDGTVMGYGVSDAHGGFPYFEGNKAIAGSPDAPVEQVAVWRYLQEKRPWLFIEWHSNHWVERPGHMLLRYDRSLLEDKDRLRIWEDFEDRLLDIPYTFAREVPTNRSSGYTNSIGLGVATELGGIPIMIKQHDKFPLEICREHAISCLMAAAESYATADSSQESHR